jgi:hypothetical protein
MVQARYLGQAAAVEKDIREKTNGKVTEVHRLVQKPELLTGQTRDYTPLVETDNGAEQLPSIRERVQFTVHEVIDLIRDELATMFDATASKDWTNAGDTGARADVRVGEIVLIELAPVPYLLWLEHQLENLEKFADKLPTHDPSSEWELVDDRGVYRSRPTETMRQVQQPMSRVIAPGDQWHAAQVQAWQEQVPVGRWTIRKLTGSIPVAARASMLRRIRELQRAVDIAREEANRTEVEHPAFGAGLVSYVFG